MELRVPEVLEAEVEPLESEVQLTEVWELGSVLEMWTLQFLLGVTVGDGVGAGVKVGSGLVDGSELVLTVMVSLRWPLGCRFQASAAADTTKSATTMTIIR